MKKDSATEKWKIDTEESWLTDEEPKTINTSWENRIEDENMAWLTQQLRLEGKAPTRGPYSPSKVENTVFLKSDAYKENFAWLTQTLKLDKASASRFIELGYCKNCDNNACDGRRCRINVN